MKSWQLMAGVFIIGLCASAQQAQQTGTQAQQPEKRETEAETIARCINDLKSADVLQRRKAAMLLGKYSGELAERALVGCLKDEDAQIRLGALVSLHEDRSLPLEACPVVFQMLSDADVHVRRMASSMAGEALVGGGLDRRVVTYPNAPGRRIRGAQTASAGECDDNERRLLDALDDADASVRKNILTVCRMYGVSVPPERLAVFLKDPSEDIRLLVLQLYHRRILTLEHLEQLSVLGKDPSPAVRREYCLLCGAFDRLAEPNLRQLLVDEDMTVRLLAVRQLMLLQAKDTLPMALKMLDDTAIPVEQRVQLVEPLAYFPPDDAGQHLRRLAGSSSSTLAAAAMRALALNLSLVETADYFIPYVDSESSAVAKAALLGIRRRQKTLTAENLAAMLAMKNHDAKTLALAIGLALLPPEQAGQFLMDACMDNDTAVRIGALRQLARFHPDGWIDILVASIEDDDEEIQRTAALELLRVRTLPEPRKALKQYAPKCRDPQLKARLDTLLSPPVPRRKLQ